MNYRISPPYLTNLLVAIGVLFLGFSAAKGDAILVAFDGDSTNFVAGGPGGTDSPYFNMIGNGVTQSLVDYNDTPTNLTFALTSLETLTYGMPSQGFGSGSNTWISAAGISYSSTLANGYLVDTYTEAFGFVIHGLTIGQDYNISLISATNSGSVNTWSVSGATTPANVIYTDNAGSSGNGVAYASEGTFTNISSNTGSLFFTVEGTVPHGTALTAVEIIPTPEPSTIVLMLVGTLGLFIIAICCGSRDNKLQSSN